MLGSASSCQPALLLPRFLLPTRDNKWADRQGQTGRWAASAVTSRFVGPFAAPCSFPLRGLCSHSLAPTLTNRRPSRTRGRATFEKSSMAPNGRSPCPCSGHGLREGQREDENTFIDCRPSLRRQSCQSCQSDCQPGLGLSARPTKQITDETIGPLPRSPSSGPSSTHPVSPLHAWELLLWIPKTPHLFGRLGHRILFPLLRIQFSVSQSLDQPVVSQSMPAGQGPFVIPSLPSSPALGFF